MRVIEVLQAEVNRQAPELLRLQERQHNLIAYIAHGDIFLQECAAQIKVKFPDLFKEPA